MPVGGRAGLGCVGLFAVLMPGLFIAYTGAWSGLINPVLPVDVRCAHVLDFIFLRHWFVTLPCMAIMTGGTYSLVTAVMNRRRLLFHLGIAVVLMWVVVGLIAGLFVWAQVAR